MYKKSKPKNKRQKGNLIKINEVIPAVKESLKLEKNLNIIALKEVWPLVTSFEASNHSQPAYFDKENNLVIAVNNGALAVELSMQKPFILKRLREATKNTDITFKDIRFIHRSK